MFNSLKRSISRKKRTIVHKCFVSLFSVSIVSWDKNNNNMNSCGTKFVAKSRHVRFLSFLKLKNNIGRNYPRGFGGPKDGHIDIEKIKSTASPCGAFTFRFIEHVETELVGVGRRGRLFRGGQMPPSAKNEKEALAKHRHLLQFIIFHLPAIQTVLISAF